MLGQTFGEGAAALHGVAEFGNRRLQDGIALLFFQHRQTAQERQSRVDQRSQLAGEDHENLLLDLLVGGVGHLLNRRSLGSRFGDRSSRRLLGGFRRGAAFSLFVDTGRKLARLTKLADRVVSRSCFDEADGLLSACIQSDVVKLCHNSEGCGLRLEFLCGLVDRKVVR